MHKTWKTLIPVIAIGALALPPVSAQTVVDSTLMVEPVITSGSISTAVNMAFVSDETILVNEKNTGIVKVVTNGVVTGNALDLSVNTSSERGLLGIALDPLFDTNNFVYLYHTVSSVSVDSGNRDNVVENRVSRFTWNGTTLTNPITIISLPVLTGPNHDGGIITFGPPTAAPADQKLYVVVGDLNRTNQNQNYSGGNAPDDSGVVIRINPDGSTPSGADKGPFFDVPGANAALQRQFAYGVRNSFGMGFDPVSGALWDSENGASSFDEINRIDPAFNSGWRYVMGPQSGGVFEGAPGLVQFGGIGNYSDPEFSWQQVVAPTAIHFYTGTGIGGHYQNDLFLGDNNNGRLYHFDLDAERQNLVLTGALADKVANTGDNLSAILFGQSFGAVGDIETGPDGQLYVLSISNNQIYRISGPKSDTTSWAIY